MTILTEQIVFPDVSLADTEGLLAVGGDLSPERLSLAYRNGIFPWYNPGSPILWWSPDPRMVLYPKNVKVSKSMRQLFKSDRFRLTKNTRFEEVIENCSSIERVGQKGTWISEEMKQAYIALHETGRAVSYEVWEDSVLVGGLYGVDLGHVFCGESMFSKVSNASKFAFIKLAEECLSKGYELIDCQLYTKHLESLGAEEIPRENFIAILSSNDAESF